MTSYTMASKRPVAVREPKSRVWLSVVTNICHSLGLFEHRAAETPTAPDERSGFPHR